MSTYKACCPKCGKQFLGPKGLGGHMRGACAPTPEQRAAHHKAYLAGWWKDNTAHIRNYRITNRKRIRFVGKKWAQENLEKTKAYKKKQEERLRAFVDSAKAGGCVDCGEKDLRCLEFDHRRGKKVSNLATMMADHRPIKVLGAEISKCEVRCANCHRKRTWSENRNGYQQIA